VGSAGRTPSGVFVNVGNGVGVRIANVGVPGPGVAVESEPGVNAVDEGRGRGGFRNVYMNPMPRMHSAIKAHPRPPIINRSNVAKNFLVESIRRNCVMYDDGNQISVTAGIPYGK